MQNYPSDYKELLKEINSLKEKLAIFEKKEMYTDSAVERTKEVYFVAKHNAEKIVIKAVNIAYDIKEKITSLISNLNPQDIEGSMVLLQNFKNDNSNYLGNHLDESRQRAKDIANDISEKIKTNV